MAMSANRGSSLKSKTANSVDTDDMARSEPSHLDLHRLHKYMFRSAGIKG